MIKMFVTGAVVSKGFNGAEAIRFSENSENPCARFRIGVHVYDKRAENNHRFVNISVKAFSYLVERIKDMKLAAGMYVNIAGRYDEETWEDQATHEKKSRPALIADEIEFCHNSGNGKQNGETNSTNGETVSSGRRGQSAPVVESRQTPDNFTGFEGFGGVNPFFPEG